jgi:hypothetical protein
MIARLDAQRRRAPAIAIRIAPIPNVTRRKA